MDRVRHRRTPHPERVHTGDCRLGSRGRPAPAQSVREILLTVPDVVACPLCSGATANWACSTPDAGTPPTGRRSKTGLCEGTARRGVHRRARQVP
ncbi:DUF6233 domain-containing protein [Streptomyces sp. NPDC054849]